MGVRGANQPPAVGEEDSNPVDVNDLVLAGQLLLGLLHHLELDVIRTVHADLRRGHRVGQIGEQRGERPAGLGQDLDQAARRVDGIVVPEVPVGEKDMAGQLARQRGFLFLQLGLDHGVSGPPHDGPAAVLGDVIIEDLRRLDFGDDRGARLLLQDIPGEQHHELVAPEYLPFLVHRADPIGVPVVRDPDIRAGLAHRADDILQVGHHRGIRLMIREPTVYFLIQPGHAAAEQPQGLRAYQPAHAVTAIHDDVQPVGPHVRE